MTQPNDPMPLTHTLPDWLAELPAPRLVAPDELVDVAGEDDATRDRRRALVRSIPPNYRWARLDDDRELRARVKPPAILDRADAVCRAERVVFSGAAGTGKTSTAVAMLRAAWGRSRTSTALFVPVYRLASARIQHRAGDGEAPLVEAAMTRDIVVLDDLGGEQRTATSAVPDVVMHRYDEGLTTWITTGLTWTEIEERYGSGVARRVADRALVLKFGEAKQKGAK